MKRILISLMTLMLALSLGAAVLAESNETDAVSSATVTDTTTALQSAQEAYAAAKRSSMLTDYEAELKSMVEAGTLTQEQADLLLASVKEAEALRNGVCPSCGYQFQTTGYGRGNGNGRGQGKGQGLGKGNRQNRQNGCGLSVNTQTSQQ